VAFTAKMKFTIEIGEQERHRIDYLRDWFGGTERLSLDGKVLMERPANSPSNFFSLPLCRRFEFRVGGTEPHSIPFEKQRPLFLAAFRPHRYRVFLDGALIHEARGY
jgi:hypothetical protein